MTTSQSATRPGILPLTHLPARATQTPSQADQA
jgi:hypothetical protein